jgi:hypothetical protein
MMANHFLTLLAVLWIFHFLVDYPLQGDFLAKGKNFNTPIPGVPWYWCMSAHCAIQAGAVWLITGSWILALFEFTAHFAIDSFKCDGALSFTADQVLHLSCKIFWAALFCVSLWRK